MTQQQAPTGGNGVSIKFILILIAVVFGLFAIIYFAGRKAGKGNAWSVRDFGAINKSINNQEIPSNWSPDTLSKKLFDVMDGVFTLQSTKDDAYSQLNALTDSQIRAVYVSFNQLPGVKKPDTLTTWIKDEWIDSTPKIAALARLQQLNLP
jgi:hypothetical protein